MRTINDKLPFSNNGAKDRKGSKSPFFSRAYGGFTEDQVSFYLTQASPKKGRVVFDPMGGQGYFLSELAYQGANLWLGDLNPSLNLMSILRDPALILKADQLTNWMMREISFLKNQRKSQANADFIHDWLAPSIKKDLDRYEKHFNLRSSFDPFSYDTNYSSLSMEIKFAAALPILAARELTCFQISDNRTWPKKGGLVREFEAYSPIMCALNSWHEYAKNTEKALTIDRIGTISVCRTNAETGLIPKRLRPDVIITSPPYANRLDYSQMWAPELIVLSTLWGRDIIEVKNGQIGSNVIKDVAKDISESELPPFILDSIWAIKNDKSSYASERYYYPYFRNYALSMTKTFTNLSKLLKPNGMIIVFVRDTVRKDILFPTAELVCNILENVHGFHNVVKARKIIKSHVGQMRKTITSGVYGIAQQEWWISLKKGKK